MFLNKISILNYKNIKEAEFNLSPKMNCFLGNNGMGKTNFLDAIYYLSFCKSHSNLPDTQNILYEKDFFVIQGDYLVDGKEEEIYCGFKRRQKKQFKRNKKEYEKFSDHIGYIPLVMISPSDFSLIQGGSEERRKFMDVVISQYDSAYLESLIVYNRALQQRNMILNNEHFSDDSLFDLWEDTMASSGLVIYQKRLEYITDLMPVFQNYYKYISLGTEEISLKYESHLSDGNLKQILFSTRDRDKIVGYTTKGIHKDELEMRLNGHLIRKIGSQGQNKTYLIALKFAQFDYLKKQGARTPILLLDDVFDKLDAKRVEQIVHLVAGDKFGQIFITDTNRKYLDEILSATEQDYLIFQVKNGAISELVK